MTGLILMLLALTYSITKDTEVEQWSTFETSYETCITYNNPFMDIEVNVVFELSNKKWVVPAFWAGGNKWTIRFAPPEQGKYKYYIESTDKANPDLNGKEQTLTVTAYKGNNPLLKHGFIQINTGKKYFEFADGTPFLWLGDTWWKNLCKRMTWEGFQELTADRKAKGFSVVQIVCGPYPDEGPFEPSWENEGGMPYETRDFSVVNTRYFEYADRRIKYLIEKNIVPAIVGAWGRTDCDAMQNIGIAGLKRHWRNLIARYGAYPVVWILAGEIPDETKWGQGPWAELAKYVRSIDPYPHPLTSHTSPGNGRKGGYDHEILINFDMVGGNHNATVAISKKTLSILTDACAKTPVMPVLVGETCYEGHMQQGFQDVQRYLFWMYILNGAAGHTYGAAGVWHASVEGDPGVAKVYDWTTWREGMNYPGSTQLGLGKKLLEQYLWWQFEPHPDWVDTNCFAAGIAGEVRFIYQPKQGIYNWEGPRLKNLEPNVIYKSFYFDPASGRRFNIGIIMNGYQLSEDQLASVKKSFSSEKIHIISTRYEKAPPLPSPQDWILVLERLESIHTSP